MTRLRSKADLAKLEALEILTGTIQRRIGEGHDSLEIADLVDDYTTAVGALDDEVAAALDAMVQHYPRTGGARPWVAHVHGARLTVALRAGVDAILGERDSAGVKSARAGLLDAEAALAAARQKLNDAVGSGDVEAVMQLRTETEVLLPNAVAQARVALAEAEMSAAESVVDAPTTWVQRKAAEHQAATERRDAARSALKDAEATVLHTGWLAESARQISADLQLRVSSRATALHAARSEAEAGSASRLRRLAGLEIPA